MQIFIIFTHDNLRALNNGYWPIRSQYSNELCTRSYKYLSDLRSLKNVKRTVQGHFLTFFKKKRFESKKYVFLGHSLDVTLERVTDTSTSIQKGIVVKVSLNY